MHLHHAAAIARIPQHWRTFIRRYYALPAHVSLVHSLLRRGITHTDLTLMLARRRGAHSALAALLGRPVLLCPPCRLNYRVNGPPSCVAAVSWRDKRITYVDRGATRLYGSLLRKNCTPRNLRASGVPWRTLDRVYRSGAMRIAP